MSFKILPIMNQSDSPVPLYTNISRGVSNNSHGVHYKQGNNGEGGYSTRKPSVYELMREVEYNLDLESRSFSDHEQSRSRPRRGLRVYNHSSPGRFTDEQINSILKINSTDRSKKSKHETCSLKATKSGVNEVQGCFCKNCLDSYIITEDNIKEVDTPGTVGSVDVESSVLYNESATTTTKSLVNRARPIVHKPVIQNGKSTTIYAKQTKDKKSHEQEHCSSLTHDKFASYEQQRVTDMMNLRMRLAKAHGYDKSFLRPMKFQDGYINVYSKGLPHDDNGFVNKEEMVKLIVALEARDLRKLSQVKLGGKIKLVNPSAAWSNDIVGACSNTYRYSQLPSLSSDHIASEMVELYCMSLARDIPFTKYYNSEIIEDCCGYLKHLKKYPQVNGKVTPENIFRGTMDGDLQGPYISQLLYRDMRMGGFLHKQKYPTDLEGYDFMKTWETAISAQNGIITESPPPTRSCTRYIITGRDLASYVHSNEPYQAFYNCSVILTDLKVPMNPGIVNVMNESRTESFFVDLGKSDIQSILSLVGRSALAAAWYVKWNSLFPRPEAIAIEVERVFRNGKNTYCFSPELLNNPVLEAVRSRNFNVLLPQAYCEGAPLHPATPSGHAATAGACVTVLKFFFDNKHEIDVYEPDTEGRELTNTGKKTTVGDELNKLASNMGIGRNWAGIHYHMDAIKGLKLGQRVAISCLQDIVQRYPHKLKVSLELFNKKEVEISNY